jgi:hypothetical protein
MKSLLKIMFILGLALQGAAFAEEWSTHSPSSQSFKTNEHGWSVSTRPQFRPFDPIIMPRVMIVPVIQTKNPNVYYRERYDHFQRHYRRLERRFYR